MKNLTRIFHITHVSNLPSIIREGGIYSSALLSEKGIRPQSIAHQSIKNRRALKPVPIHPKGVLADYVPFYFTPLSPMLYAIHVGAVEGYRGGQGAIVHCVACAEVIAAQGIPFVFTDGHAVMELSTYYNDLRHLQNVDWTVIRSPTWHDTPADPDRKRRRQAEFLVHQFVPWDLIQEVGVIDSSMQDRVARIMRANHRQIAITVRRDWYY